MNPQRLAPKAFLLIATLLALPTASFAQVKVLISGGFSAAFQEVLPDFEKSTGITVTATRAGSQGSGQNTIGALLRRGTPADVVILSREGLDDLAKEGRVANETVVDLAQTPLALAVHAGVPKPDISTVEGFKQALLRAKSINAPSTGGIYLKQELLPRLGIAPAVSGKINDSGIASVVSGESDIAFRPVSEVFGTEGIDFVGPIPQELQKTRPLARLWSREPSSRKRPAA